MKSFVLSLALLISVAGFSQDKKQCQATTKAGTQCKHSVTEGSYCKAHDPKTPRCGAKTKAGGECKAIVKQAGDKCHNHKNN